MLCFQPLKLSDIKRIRPYFAYSLSRDCDSTVGGTFMWRDFFNTEYCILNNTFIAKAKYFGGRTAFAFPLGEDIPSALYAISEYCESENIPLVFCSATDEEASVYSSYFSISCHQEPDWSDYLYSANDFISLSGRRYSGQRNHIHSFIRNFPTWHFDEIDSHNISVATEFFTEFCKDREKDSPIFHEEQAKVFEVLDNYTEYGFLGGILFCNEYQPVAFALGERKGDTLFIHVEKADITIRGSYQMIANEFARHFTTEDIKYINREEDVGDEGLRISKQSYHPCDMVKKYTVTASHK